MRLHVNSLRARLILIVLVALVPSLGGAFVTGLDERNSAVARAESDVLRGASLVSAQFDRIVESTHATLVSFAAVPEVRYHVAADCSALARNLRDIYPAIANLGASDAAGEVFCSGYQLTETTRVSDRIYFREALQTRSFVGSAYQTSRTTGKPTISYALPLIGDDGQVLAVVLASLDLQYLNDRGADFGLPPDYTLTVAENTGRILIRYPDPQPSATDTISPEILGAITGDQSEGVGTTIGLNGSEQIVGFRRLNGLLSDSPVYALVAVASDSVRGESHAQLAATLIGIGLSALFALAFAVFGAQSVVVKPIHSLLGSLAQLRAGDYSARAEVVTGTTEIRQIATAFDDVAAALESREAAILETSEALREREEQYRLVFEAAADAILLFDAETGRVLDANAAASWLYGYSRSELLGMSDGQLSAEPEKTIQARRADVRRVPLRYQRRKDGTIFAAESSASAIRIGGRLARLSSIRDTTAKLESERALRESEARHRLLFSQMISGFVLGEVVCDGEGEPIDLRLLQINAAFERQTGLNREEAIDRTVREVAPGTEERWIKRLGWVALNGDSISFTDRLHAIDREFEVYAYSPQPGQVAATLQDVTDRRSAERELEQRTRDLQSLHEIAGVIASEQNVLLAVNEVLKLARMSVSADVCCFCASLKTAGELGQMVDGPPVGPDDGQDESRLVLIAMASRGEPPESPATGWIVREPAIVEVAAELATANGSAAKTRSGATDNSAVDLEQDPPGWLDVPVRGREGDLGIIRVGRKSGLPFSDHQRRFLLGVGHQVGLVVENNHLAADATQVEVLRQMDRLRSEFIANVSHELRTPLGLIVLAVSTLRRESGRLTEAMRTNLIASVEDEAGRLTRLVENLVDISRLQSGRLELLRRSVDLREAVSSAVREFGPRLAEFAVELDLPGEPILASIDRERIDHVLRNLLTNAIQYSRTGTKIRVSARCLAGVPFVKIEDEGIGIPPEETRRIFERFYRVDSEHGRRVSGVGLGLAICQSIVHAHGGEIRVESAPGVGSAFSFTLPHPAGEAGVDHGAWTNAAAPGRADVSSEPSPKTQKESEPR